MKKRQVFGTVNDYLLFDNNNYGSGINLWFDNENNICLRVSFPTTYNEIVSLYNLVNLLCDEFNTNKFYRGRKGEFELFDISQLNWFIELRIFSVVNLDASKTDMISNVIDKFKKYDVELKETNYQF